MSIIVAFPRDHSIIVVPKRLLNFKSYSFCPDNLNQHCIFVLIKFIETKHESCVAVARSITNIAIPVLCQSVVPVL